MMGCPSLTHQSDPHRLEVLSPLTGWFTKKPYLYSHFLMLQHIRESITYSLPKILSAEKMKNNQMWKIIEKVTKASSSRVIILPSLTVIKRTGHCLALGQKSEVDFWCLSRLNSPSGLVPGPESLQPRGHKASNQMLWWSQRENSSWRSTP